ncbi:MAG TPA: GGDEF domain-containing protein [Xanthobacteraceae bacterium]|nr:GGDEF domain-containing protein [Xanthobacteraceae bacterium]
MIENHDEHERTLSFAETALNQIKALKLAAHPRNFEVLYAYATGHHPGLNQAINDVLSRGATLTDQDLSRLYDQHLSPARISERIEEVGGKIMGEIEQVMSMIDAAIGSANNYSESLAGATEIASDADREQLRLIVETLVRSTQEVEVTNQALQKRLTDSREEIRELQENLEVVRTEALTDPLTMLSNRKYLEDAITHFIAEAETKGAPFSVILTDIDHFKKFNDTYGHLTGDQVLRLVAHALKQNLKGQDVAARYGGEEFAVLLPRTALADGATVAEHIRHAVMSKELVRRSSGETLGRVTISLGVAAWRRDDTMASLLERADACLYAAKRAGRNCVVEETTLEQRSQRVA